MSHTPCLTPSQMMRILEVEVPPDEAARSDEHLDQCSDCRALLVDLVKTYSDIPGGGPSVPQ